MKLPFALALTGALVAPLAMAPAAFAGTTSVNPTAVHFVDLDLDTAAGKATLDARIRNAAHRICEAQVTTGSSLPSQACLRAVRSEVLAKVDEYQNHVGKGG